MTFEVLKHAGVTYSVNDVVI